MADYSPKGLAVASPVPVRRGAQALRHVLNKQTYDLRELDEAEFRSWLIHRVESWSRDPVFAQRVRIRDLRQAWPELRILERERRRLAAADADSAAFARLSWLEQKLIDTERAITGLTNALQQSAPERRPALQHKLATFRAQQQALKREHRELIRTSKERQALVRIEQKLRRLRKTSGLEQEETQLATLLRERGQRSGRAGQSFEQLALAITEQHIIPDWLSDNRGPHSQEVWVLQGVTLGAARLELDQLVVRVPCDNGQPVEVLALVEVKRNINDLAHGFHLRQENLAWLTGETAGYDPADYQTRRFRSGRFDGKAVHNHEGQALVFTPHSFRRFKRDPQSGLFLDRLYFITRNGPVWGVSSAALERISYRIATDEAWAPENPNYLRKLQRWRRSLTQPRETPDVFRAYLAAHRSRQILLIDEDKTVLS